MQHMVTFLNLRVLTISIIIEYISYLEDLFMENQLFRQLQIDTSEFGLIASGAALFGLLKYLLQEHKQLEEWNGSEVLWLSTAAVNTRHLPQSPCWAPVSLRDNPHPVTVRLWRCWDISPIAFLEVLRHLTGFLMHSRKPWALFSKLFTTGWWHRAAQLLLQAT